MTREKLLTVPEFSNSHAAFHRAIIWRRRVGVWLFRIFADGVMLKWQGVFLMRLPANTYIDLKKLTEYLLRWRPEDDKSGFLALGGYSVDNADELLLNIREQILPLETELIEQTEYGPKYRIRSMLTGPNGRSLSVVTIWLTEDATNETKFVTLLPDKR